MRRLVLLAGIVAAVLGLSADPAAAHAVLVATTPADGARLDEVPEEVVFEFNEPVSATTGAVRVFGSTGARVDDGTVDVTGATVTVALRDDLGDGAYVASYRVLSADGHPVSGAIAFAVGDGPPDDDAVLASLFDDDADRPWEVAGAVLRWLAYSGALVAAGGAFYLVAVDDDGRRETVRLLRVAAGVGAATVVAHLFVQAHLASGLGIGSLFRGGVAGDVLADGVGSSAVVVVAGLIAVAVGLAVGGAARRGVLLVGAVAAAAGFAVTGHSRTSDPRWLATGADVIHLLAAAVWFGGLVLLAAAVRRHRRDDDPAAAGRVVGRWSRSATVAVLAVGAAGIALSWSEVRSLDALTSTGYGRLLLVKIALVAAIAAIGAYNNVRLVPALEAATVDRPRRTVWRHLRRTVRLEAAGIVIALAVTGALVQVTPARAELAEPFSTTIELGDGSVNLVVDPARVGPAELHLYMLDAGGRVADLAPDGLTIELSLPDHGIEPLIREPYVAGPGHYQLDGDVFAVAGTWQVEIVARTSRFDTATATAEVPIRR